MKLYRISKCDFINDLSGLGAALYGGRWNSKGTYILYTAESSSLALLETVAHITTIASSTYCMACLEISDSFFEEYGAESLPGNWQMSPSPVSLRQIGDEFIKRNKSIGLKVPSVLVPDEYNYLLNPAHADFKRVKVIFIRSLPIDSRLVKI